MRSTRLVLLILLLAWGGGLTWAQVTFPYSEDFEAFVAGATSPTHWIGGTVVEGTAHSGTKSLLVGPSAAVYNATLTFESGKTYKTTYWFYVDEFTGDGGIHSGDWYYIYFPTLDLAHFGPSWHELRSDIYSGSAGLLNVNEFFGFDWIVDVSPTGVTGGEWHKVEVIMDIDNSTNRYRFDDVAMGVNGSTTEFEFSIYDDPLLSDSFSVWATNSYSKIYIDDVQHEEWSSVSDWDQY